MITTMNMSSYEIEQDEMETEYGEEIMCAGWNPAVELVSEQLQEVEAGELMPVAAELDGLDTPDDVATAISEIFLRKMYSYQR
ncbi:MAG: hypothetical protein HY938_10470 [Nitrosomonadales bacterium]|nr:hypothetical protein [Nitrosomonadales bacterium]